MRYIPVIREVSLDESVCMFARLSAVSAINVMYAEGVIDREYMIVFYEDLFKSRTDDDDLFLLLSHNCAELHFNELTDLIKPHYDEDKFLFNESWEGWQEALSETTRENAVEKFKEQRWGRYIANCEESMSWRRMFKPKS